MGCRAFDRGLVSFGDDGSALLSRRPGEDARQALGEAYEFASTAAEMMRPIIGSRIPFCSNQLRSTLSRPSLARHSQDDCHRTAPGSSGDRYPRSAPHHDLFGVSGSRAAAGRVWHDRERFNRQQPRIDRAAADGADRVMRDVATCSCAMFNSAR
jgi:hypothetical protein